MRIKLLLFTLLCSLAAIMPAKAETLTVYDGTTTNNHVPAYIYYWDDFTRSECVIPSTALESMTGGTITAIKFYTNSDNVPYTSVASAYMYMTEVNSTSISNYVTRDNATIVYTGTLEIVSANGGGEVTITFDTPYTYGGGNLVIGTENISDAGYKNIKFYGQTVSGASIAGSSSSASGTIPVEHQDFIPKTTFTYTPGSSCKRPTNLTASNVVYDGATLTWTPGDAEQDAWQVVYGTGNFDPDAATPVNVTGNATYTLTGLTENTTYHAYVRGNCGGGDVSVWSQVCTFTTPERFAHPTNLTVSDITAHTAKASWNGDANSYNLRYRKVLGYNETFSESFETFPGSWTIIDSDGDGNNWTQFNPMNFSEGGFTAYDGQYGAMSRSWLSSGALTPDNWLISPQVDLGGVLKYYIVDDGSYQETYRIYVSTTGTNIADFQPITDDLLSPASTTWTERTADLTAFEGQRGYIAFRQYNCTDQDFMLIDAVSIEAMTYGDWVEVDGVTSPYTITGLDAETDYVVQVQGVYDEGNSSWSNSVLFTTAAADAMPTDLTVADITDCTATANWNGSQDSYNLRYRKLELASDFEDSSLGGWTTIDADGDGYNWVLGSAVGGVYLDEGASMVGSGHSPQNLIVSGSYSNVSGVGALTPDNYLVSPKVQLGGTITFWAKGHQAAYCEEVFGVAVSTSGNTNAADFTMVGQTQTATADWVQYEFDLSAYAGQEGYVAIRHYDITDMFLLDIDDIYISAPGGWVTINNVTSPYTIENLDPETDYEVQVQGVVDSETTTNWTESELFTTLMKWTTLAEICQNGVITEGQNEYVIADKLIAVYADDVKGILWCKDQGNASVFSTSIIDGQVDFLKNDPLAQNGRDWDQSNWIALHFSTPTATNNIGQLVNGAVNRYIKPGTVKGKLIDDVNYALRMDLDQLELVTQADDPDINPDYIPNVYCPANFMPTNLNIWGNEEDGGYTEGSDQNYFFMNPKIQEICEVTYAQWDAINGCFTVPTSSGFDGAFYIGTGYNVIQSQNFISSLQDEHIYKFKAIVQRSDKDNYGPKNVTTPATGITLYPVDLDPVSSEIPTAINTIKANGEVVGVEYVNSLGVVSKTPFQGVNIIVTRYSDGATTTVKKVFK